MRVEPRYVDPAVEMEAIRSYFAALLARRDLSFDLTYGDDLPRRLRYDSVIIRRCVGDMIANAAALTTAAGVDVRIVADRPTERLVRVAVEVSDAVPARPGDPPKSKAPEPDEHSLLIANEGEALLTSRLRTARRLARLLGGDVQMAGAPEQGSVVTLSFLAETVEAPRARAASPPPAAATALTGARILVVDDIATNRRIARLLMEETGADIEEAKGGAEALRLLDEKPFDLMLLDSHMPGMSGEETLLRLREGPHKTMPVLAFTAETGPTDRARLLAAGMDGFVTKPVDFDTLVREAVRLLKR